MEITKERVLEAASKCSQAKETLKTLFPEAFDEKVVIQDFLVEKGAYDRMIFIAAGLAPAGYELRSFGLNEDFNWKIVPSSKDSSLILIPTKK